MEHMNIVRMRVRPGKLGQWKEIVEASLNELDEMPGALEINYVQTDKNAICVVGRWSSEEALAAARPRMIAVLDRIRDILEPLSNELGVTDPVSGPVILHRSKRTAGPRP